MWIAVVLPAPFGPRKPNISPRSTRNEKSSRALTRSLRKRLRYSLLMLSNSSAAGEGILLSILREVPELPKISRNLLGVSKPGQWPGIGECVLSRFSSVFSVPPSHGFALAGRVSFFGLDLAFACANLRQNCFSPCLRGGFLSFPKWE